MQQLLILLLLAATLSCAAQAQSGKQKKTKTKETTLQNEGPTTLDPFYQPKNAAPVRTKNKGKGKGPTYDSQKEFDDRMAARAKTNRKNERLFSKPQYSDPSYFGHKRPPKKRAPGKMKFCKECGLRH